MNAQISIMDGSYRLIHIPLGLYGSFLQPILRLLLPQEQSLAQHVGGVAAGLRALGLGRRELSHRHAFLNVSVTPVECSIVCDAAWASVFEARLAQLYPDEEVGDGDGKEPRVAAPPHPSGVVISHDEYLVMSVTSAGMDAASRVVDLASPLALAGVPIFFISTYYSDFILAPARSRRAVARTLRFSGFELSRSSDDFVEQHQHPGSDSGPFDDEDEDDQEGDGDGQSEGEAAGPSSSSVDGLQTRTFDALRRRRVAPLVEPDLELIPCSGKEFVLSGGGGLFGRETQHAYLPGEESLAGRGRDADSLGDDSTWIDSVDTKLYLGLVAALASQPRFLSVTLAAGDEPSLLLDRELQPIFGDSLVGDITSDLVPIFLDLTSMPLEATGIVSGVVGRLVRDLQMDESAELSYLSTTRAGAVIFPKERAEKALEVLTCLLRDGGEGERAVTL